MYHSEVNIRSNVYKSNASSNVRQSNKKGHFSPFCKSSAKENKKWHRERERGETDREGERGIAT